MLQCIRMLGMNQIVKVVAEKSGLSQNKSKQFLDATLQVITEFLAVGEDVTIPHLGRFRVHKYPSRTIPDPKGSGGTLVLLPKNVVKFKPSMTLRKSVEVRKGKLHRYSHQLDENGNHKIEPPIVVDTISKVDHEVNKPAEIKQPADQIKTKDEPIKIKPIAEKEETDKTKKSPNWLILFSKLKQKRAAEQAKPSETVTEPTNDQKTEEESPELKQAVAPVNISFQDLSNIRVDKKILNLLPEMFARRHNSVVIGANKNEVTVAMVDPENLETIQLIKKSTGRNVVPVLASGEDISRILNQYSGLEAEVASAVKDTTFGISKKEIAEAEQENVELSGDDSPTARIVTSLLRRAVREKSSDVHIEPYEKSVVVRFRIDGVLSIRVKLPKDILPAIISRLKILSNLKIDEHRLPQDGRFRLTIDNRDIDFRLSTLPVADGEKAVMRILDKAQGILSLEEIGIRGRGYDTIKTNIKRSYGMTLVTGPTGSGKTTTLYALLGQLMDVGVNIITLENPIEYRIEGINQSQINPNIKYDFATGLRAIVRQDPDIIMVGEIRDKETAEIAIQSALTGHIVLSTLHTNTAAGTIPRLIDMGVEPFLISSSINTIIAQRLARKLCDQCKTKHQPTSKEIDIIKDELSNLPEEAKAISNLKNTDFYEAKGCDVCNHTGYQGRIGLFEILNVSEPQEQLILATSTDTKIQALATKEGMMTMLQDGVIKAIDGITSLEEVWRVTRD